MKKQRPMVVLVVGQDPSIGRIAGNLSAAGFCVRKADSASEGIGLARRERPDLIVVSARLPGIDGATAIRILRDDPMLRDVRVVLIAGSAGPPEAGP